jgi:hypothetical protein
VKKAIAEKRRARVNQLPTKAMLQQSMETTLCDSRGVYLAATPSSVPVAEAPSVVASAALDLPFLAPSAAVANSAKGMLAASKTEAQFWTRDYNSPLLTFRSYRLNPFFQSQAKQKVSSLTFANKIDPFREMCPYELHGSCRDPSCEHQHEREYTRSDSELAQVRQRERERWGAERQRG